MGKRMRLSALGCCFILGLIATGCGTGQSVQGAPLPGGNGAPDILKPLTSAEFEQNPCDLLTADQTREIANLQHSEIAGGSAGLTCHWTSAVEAGQTGNNLDVGFLHGNGLRDIYEQHSGGDPGYFVPVPDVAGYPGVFSALVDARASGGCTLFVGIRNDEILSFSGLLKSPELLADSCAPVRKIAELAISRLNQDS